MQVLRQQTQRARRELVERLHCVVRLAPLLGEALGQRLGEQVVQLHSIGLLRQ